jgi:hypothetical protein
MLTASGPRRIVRVPEVRTPLNVDETLLQSDALM